MYTQLFCCVQTFAISDSFESREHYDSLISSTQKACDRRTEGLNETLNAASW